MSLICSPCLPTLSSSAHDLFASGYESCSNCGTWNPVHGCLTVAREPSMPSAVLQFAVCVTRAFRLLRTAGVTVACIGNVDVCLAVSVTPFTLPVCQSELHLLTDRALSLILVSKIEQHVYEITRFLFTSFETRPVFLHIYKRKNPRIY
jgi:hypothetical protein